MLSTVVLGESKAESDRLVVQFATDIVQRLTLEV